jgi:predicted HicB family RNase H-like nuclease
MCAEFPSLSWLAESQVKALEGICALVRDTLEDMQKNNEQIPQPISQRRYSGKISLRLTPDTHRMIAIKAAEQGVSINRYISSVV